MFHGLMNNPVPDWPRRKAVAEFLSCVGHDCLGTHLHRNGIRPRPPLHAMQPPRTHGQKPSRTMYRIIWYDRMWAILGGQNKNDGKL